MQGNPQICFSLCLCCISLAFHLHVTQGQTLCGHSSQKPLAGWLSLITPSSDSATLHSLLAQPHLLHFILKFLTFSTQGQGEKHLCPSFSKKFGIFSKGKRSRCESLLGPWARFSQRPSILSLHQKKAMFLFIGTHGVPSSTG